MTDRNFYYFLVILFTNWDVSNFQTFANFKRCQEIKGNITELTRVLNTDMLLCAQLCSQYSECTSYSYMKHNRECGLYEAGTNVSVLHGTSTLLYLYTKLPAIGNEPKPSQHTSLEFGGDAIKKGDLHKACKEGKLGVVKYILTQGLADINFRGKGGRTPVMEAAKYSQLEVFNYLVEQGCNLSMSSGSNNNVLHFACAGGNLTIVQYLVNRAKCNIEGRGSDLKTPVMCAVLGGHKSVVDFLASKHCNLKALNKYGNTILHIACEGGHLDMVKHILSLNVVGLERKGGGGRTPVMCAAVNGHVSVVDFLKTKHCNLKAVNVQGSNLLHEACAFGYVDMVKHILTLGVPDIESKGAVRRTPVMYAVMQGHRSVVDFLISKHCNLKVVDGHGDTLLHLACAYGHVDMVKHIFNLGVAGIERKGTVERTPVMCAVREGHRSVVDFLISKHCNLKAVADHGSTILHVACEGGHVDMVKYILSLGVVAMETKDNAGRSPVMYAVKHGQRSVVDFLISKHCNLKAVDNQGSTILHVACKIGNVDMVKHILSLGVVAMETKDNSGESPAMNAVENGHRSVVDFLISKHCNLKSVDNQGSTILHRASLSGNVDMVKHILSLGVFGIEEKGAVERTPVMYAVLGGYKPMIDFLVSKHCNLKAVDSQGNNILHVACTSGNVDMLKHVLSLGVADIESKGSNGMTPVMVAIQYNKMSVVNFLASEHCNLKAVDVKGNTILQQARRYGHVSMIERILFLTKANRKG